MNQTNFWIDFALILNNVVNTSIEFNDNKSALNYINFQMKNILYPKLKLFTNEANEYLLKRDNENCKIKKDVEHILQCLKILMLDIQFDNNVIIMSSYQARLNLINDFDIDIGILVKNLDNSKFSVLYHYLENNGYKFIKTINPTSIKNCYHSFQKNINNIEVEVKVRDMDYCKIIVDLHNYLDNNLSEEERSLFTYAKYKLKNLEDISGYKCFKKLIYEYGFSCTNPENGFLFIM